MRPEIRPATAADLRAFYDEGLQQTVRAYVGVLDGRVLGAGGIAYEGGIAVAFCDLSDEARQHKLAIYRISRMVIDMARRHGIKRLLAVATEPTTPAWLTRLGFRPLGDSDEGEVWEWVA